MENQPLLNQIVLRFPAEFQEHRDDLSAILLTPDNNLWLGSDETSTLERLSLVEERTFANHYSFKVAEFIDLPESSDQEIDIEGLYYADNYIWLVGSHSWKRKRPKEDKTDIKNLQRLATLDSQANRYLLARIPLIDGQLYRSCQHPDNSEQQLSAAKLETTKKGNLLIDALQKDPHLGLFVASAVPSKDNGFDIEGLAVYQNRIFVGLRGPVLRGWAIILELEIEESKPELLKLKQIGEAGQLYKKHFVYLKGLGVRDLCFDGEDMLILAGPTMDLDGPVKVFRLENVLALADNVLSKPEPVLDLPYGDGEDHAEGITLFDSIAQEHSLLVVYDSPAKQTRLEGENGVKSDVFKL